MWMLKLCEVVTTTLPLPEQVVPPAGTVQVSADSVPTPPPPALRP
jgi:hypothetical protein